MSHVCTAIRQWAIARLLGATPAADRVTPVGFAALPVAITDAIEVSTLMSSASSGAMGARGKVVSLVLDLYCRRSDSRTLLDAVDALDEAVAQRLDGAEFVSGIRAWHDNSEEPEIGEHHHVPIVKLTVVYAVVVNLSPGTLSVGVS